MYDDYENNQNINNEGTNNKKDFNGGNYNRESSNTENVNKEGLNMNNASYSGLNAENTSANSSYSGTTSDSDMYSDGASDSGIYAGGSSNVYRDSGNTYSDSTNTYRGTQESTYQNAQNNTNIYSGNQSSSNMYTDSGYNNKSDSENSLGYMQESANIPASYNSHTRNTYSSNRYVDNTYSSNGYNENMYSSGSAANRRYTDGYEGNAAYLRNPNNYKRSGGKKGGFVKKVAVITASAVLFGTVAGGTMVAVNRYAYKPDIGSSALQEQARQTEQTSKIASIQTKDSVSGNTDADSGSVQRASNGIEAIAERSMPFVVAINGTTKIDASGWFGERQIYETPSSGSGIIIGQNDEEYLIVTNNHVIDDTSKLSVVFIDGQEVSANIKGGDADSDIAVIAVKKSDVKQDTVDKISIANLGDSGSIKVGQSVVAIGNALGYGQSVTAGIVSALNREVQTKDGVKKSLLQTDAAINPGNSGGALINMDGDVIGINSAKYSSTEVEGMGYAIPISDVKGIIDELSNQQTKTEVEESKQGYLGIRGQNIDSDMAQAYDMPRGVYVYKILEGGAAANSQLREKDIITKINAQTIRSMDDLKKQLTYYSGGEEVKLTIQRLEGSEYKEMQVTVKLGFRKDTEVNN
mgnify:FL=1